MSPRRPILGGESLQEWKDRKDSQRRLAYERKLVRQLLLRLGVAQIALTYSKPRGDPDAEDQHMTFAWLSDTYPSFPMRLVSHAIWDPPLPAFFRPTQRKNPIWSKWREFEKAVVDPTTPGLALGLVFPTPETAGLKDMILHTLELPYFSPAGDGEDFVRMQRVREDGTVFTLERFVCFAERLRYLWSPA